MLFLTSGVYEAYYYYATTFSVLINMYLQCAAANKALASIEFWLDDSHICLLCFCFYCLLHWLLLGVYFSLQEFPPTSKDCLGNGSQKWKLRMLFFIRTILCNWSPRHDTKLWILLIWGRASSNQRLYPAKILFPHKLISYFSKLWALPQPRSQDQSDQLNKITAVWVSHSSYTLD